MNEKLKDALVLLFEITVLLIIFAIFLLTLSYFKIISLPNFSPKVTTLTTAPSSSTVVSTNQTFIPANSAKLQNQASDAQMKKYQEYAAGFTKPQIQTDSNTYTSDAIFSGYDSQTIQVVTKDGILNLSFNQNTLFQKQPHVTQSENGSESSGLIPIAIKYSSQDFLKNVVLGSTLQVYFSRPNLKATQVNYFESAQPVL